MQINQYPNQATSLTVEDRFDTDKNLGLGVWQSQQFDLPTLVDGIITAFPNLFDTIYTADGVLNGNRIVEQDDFKISFLNGNVNIGTTGFTGGLFRLEVSGVNNGIYATSNNNTIFANSTSGTAITANASSSGRGLTSLAPSNLIRKNGIGIIPSIEPLSIFDVFTEDQGVRIIPRIAESVRDTWTSVPDYLEIVNTTRERKEIYLPFWGWHPVGNITPDWGYEFFDECTNASPASSFSQSILNGGTRASRLDVSVNGSPVQLIGFSTGTASNGESSHYLNGYFPGGTGKKQYETKASVSALSTLTDRYVSKVGYVTTNTGLPTDGMYFLYDEGGVSGSATASANWLCVCRNGGSYSVVDSGVAVNTTSNPLHNLKIRDYGTGNKVEFIINGVIVATITTNIPDSTKPMYIGERIVKTTGTTARLLYIDYSSVKEKFNTPR